jgi:hypothetical protein
MNQFPKFAATICLLAALAFSASAQTNSLVWRQSEGRVDASVHDVALLPLLQNIAKQTGWHIFVEPGSTRVASAKFQDLPTGDALKMLLGDLNFAYVPKSDAPSELYVFRTTMKNATRRVVAPAPAKRVPNELLVKVKPGTDIKALAKILGAKITGEMDKYGVYRLQFDSDSATDAALAQLQNNSDVQAVDYDYYFDPPPTPQAAPSASASSLSLQLNPPSSSGKVIVGLIDTDVQSLGPQLDQFMLKQIDVTDGSSSDSSITHGTAMAYTILNAIANSTGGSTSVQIQPVDVYGSGESTTSWDVALGVQAAVNAGATILNMSLGSTGDSSVLDSVISQAAGDGITMFGATGNTPIDAPYYPAADSGVIPVTALGQAGQLAPYANSWPDASMIALPGTAMVSYDGEDWVVQGTSTATAYSSGIYAGNLAAHGWTQPQILNAMENKFPVPKQ